MMFLLGDDDDDTVRSGVDNDDVALGDGGESVVDVIIIIIYAYQVLCIINIVIV